jgi:hypothetical protein
MTSSSQKFIIATKQEISGSQRKLAWFSLQSKDLYYEIAGILEGSHSSYHKDGSMWRTSPATNKQARYIKQHYPFNQFQGWFHLDIGMLLKSSLPSNPELKNRDKKHQIHFVDIDKFPSAALNLVVDLLEPNRQELLAAGDMQPPVDAQIYEFTSSHLLIFVTILGHDHNLLISPYDGDFKGVTCRHINKRYSANPPGSLCELEAYKLDRPLISSG